MILIDGSQGEGGGQIIRSSLALAMMTGQPLRLENIRAKRRQPGLRMQHLTALKAAQRVSAACVEGGEIGSSQVTFEPGGLFAGHFEFRIQSAGSTTLVLQTVLPALMLCEGESYVALGGGTHNPLAPPFDFLSACYLPQINRLGPTVSVQFERHGFFPAGGGGWSATVVGSPQLQGLSLLERGRLVGRRVRALIANLPAHIAERECDTIQRRSGWPRSCFATERVEATGPGNVVMIELNFEQTSELFVGFGKQGVKAEKIAAQTLREADRFLKSQAAVGEHLADQLLLPLAIAAQQGRASRFRTLPLSPHSTTHIDIIQRFLDIEIRVEAFADNQLVDVCLGPAEA